MPPRNFNTDNAQEIDKKFIEVNNWDLIADKDSQNVCYKSFKKNFSK